MPGPRGTQDAGGGERGFHLAWIEIPPLTLRTRICVPPPLTAASRRWPPGALQARPKSASIPPLRLRALTLAPAPEGNETLIGPFTELSEMGWHLPIRWKPASRKPFTVESSTWPSILSAVMLPLTEDAFTAPLIPLRDSPPLTSFTFSRLAPRGTLMWYSTLVGCPASPPEYWVRIETMPAEVSTTIRASFKLPASLECLMASTSTSSRSQPVIRTSP